MGSFDPDPPKERRAGLAALCIILVTTGAIIALTQIDWRRRTPYRLAFSMLQDASDIAPGVPVNVGGIRYGAVTQVVRGAVPDDDDAPDAAKPPMPKMGTLVTFEIDASIHLWPGARICRDATVLGGNVSIDIYDTGFKPRREVAQKPLDPDTTIRATNPGSGLSTFFGGPVAGRLTSLLEDIGPFQEWIRNQVGPDFSARFDSIKASFDSVRSKFRGDTDEWSARMTALKSNASDFALQLGIGSDGEQNPQSIFRMVSNVSQKVRSDAESVKSDYNAITADIEKQIGERMRKAYDDFQKQIARAKSILESTASAGSNASAVYAEFLAEFSLSGGQLSRMFGDVVGELMRALLEKPWADQIAEQDRLMVVRELAMHAQEVQITVDDLENLARLAQPASPEMSGEIRQRTKASMEALQQALESFNTSLQKHLEK